MTAYLNEGPTDRTPGVRVDGVVLVLFCRNNHEWETVKVKEPQNDFWLPAYRDCPVCGRVYLAIR